MRIIQTIIYKILRYIRKCIIIYYGRKTRFRPRFKRSRVGLLHRRRRRRRRRRICQNEIKNRLRKEKKKKTTRRVNTSFKTLVKQIGDVPTTTI